MKDDVNGKAIYIDTKAGDLVTLKPFDEKQIHIIVNCFGKKLSSVV